MSTRLLWFAPIIVLTALLAVYGFKFGWIVANLTETDVIERQAAQYLAKAGPHAKPTDCIGFPGTQKGIWIIVRCGGGLDEASKMYEYHVNRLGGVEYSGAPKSIGAQIRDEDV